MGFLKRSKAVTGLAREAYASAPRWARIVRVGHNIGTLTRIDLEVHYGPEDPFEASTLQWVPQGVTPEVGQHVTVRRSTGDDVTTYLIEWDQPVQYGRPFDPIAQLARAQGVDDEAEIDRARAAMKEWIERRGER
jgi:hypothetical protein